MSIVRAPRPDVNWYTLDKKISEDERLSWAARGLLIFLLGKPDHWEVSVKHLINQTSKALGKSSGRDAVRVILRELEEAGYLTADIARGEGGAFAGMAYTVCETPTEPAAARVKRGTDFPAPVKPQTEKPAPAKPLPENPHQVKTERKQHTDPEQNTDLSIATEAGASAGQLILAVEESKPRIEIPADMPGPKDQDCKTFRTWANYAFAYRKRYKVWPLWNKSMGVKLNSFIERVGIDAAPKIAAFYLSDNDQFVTKASHSIGLLLTNAEKYHTAWQTGRTVTTTEAQQIDKTQTNFNAAADALAILQQRREDRESANANS